jgi:V-type H+-transporting ATPase proteolipid subunit
MGAAFGTSKAGIGIAGLGQVRPDLIMKSLIPVVVSFIPIVKIGYVLTIYSYLYGYR